MDPDPRLNSRLRDRALDRLDGLTTGAAVLGVIATAGLGTVAAFTTHVPGVSATDGSSLLPVTGDPAGAGLPSDDDSPTNPTTPSVNGGTRVRPTQPSSNTGVVTAPTRSSGHRHASTGGS
jgi:hypothetical protein